MGRLHRAEANCLAAGKGHRMDAQEWELVARVPPLPLTAGCTLQPHSREVTIAQCCAVGGLRLPHLHEQDRKDSANERNSSKRVSMEKTRTSPDTRRKIRITFQLSFGTVS